MLQETRTLRIYKDVIDRLDQQAAKERVNVNVLANQALRKYVEWDVDAERFGLVTISKRLLKTLFDHLTEEEARKLGRESGESVDPALVTFWFKDFTLENTLKAFELVGSRYGKNFQFDHREEDGTHVLVMKHDGGARASAYYSESVKGVFARLGLKMEVLETEDQVVARVNVAGEALIPELTG